jgi:hypothetical protein
LRAWASFTADAKNFVERIQPRIVLIDGAMLAKEMVRRNVGVEVRDTDELDIVEDYRGPRLPGLHFHRATTRGTRQPGPSTGTPGDATLEPRQYHPPTVPPSYRRQCSDSCR